MICPHMVVEKQPLGCWEVGVTAQRDLVSLLLCNVALAIKPVEVYSGSRTRCDLFWPAVPNECRPFFSPEQGWCACRLRGLRESTKSGNREIGGDPYPLRSPLGLLLSIAPLTLSQRRPILTQPLSELAVARHDDPECTVDQLPVYRLLPGNFALVLPLPGFLVLLCRAHVPGHSGCCIGRASSALLTRMPRTGLAQTSTRMYTS